MKNYKVEIQMNIDRTDYPDEGRPLIFYERVRLEGSYETLQYMDFAQLVLNRLIKPAMDRLKELE